MAAKTPLNLKMEEGNEKNSVTARAGYRLFLSAKKCNYKKPAGSC